MNYLGGFVAVVLSWKRNRSALWVMLHGLLGWFYVIYFILTRSHQEDQKRHRERKDEEFKKRVADLVRQQKASKEPEQKNG